MPYRRYCVFSPRSIADITVCSYISSIFAHHNWWWRWCANNSVKYKTLTRSSKNQWYNIWLKSFFHYFFAIILENIYLRTSDMCAKKLIYFSKRIMYARKRFTRFFLWRHMIQYCCSEWLGISMQLFHLLRNCNQIQSTINFYFSIDNHYIEITFSCAYSRNVHLFLFIFIHAREDFFLLMWSSLWN